MFPLGNDASGVAPLTGGSGLRGWLSSMYARLTALAAAIDATGIALAVNQGLEDRARDMTSTTTTITTITPSVTAVPVVAANVNVRKGLSLWYGGANNVTITVGAAASAATPTCVLSPAYRYFEMPFGGQMQVNAVWDTAAGNLIATEYL